MLRKNNLRIKKILKTTATLGLTGMLISQGLSVPLQTRVNYQEKEQDLLDNIIADTSNINLSNLEIFTDGSIRNLPSAPEHTYWEFQTVKNDSWTKDVSVFTDLQVGSVIKIRLSPEPKYELASPLNSEVKVEQFIENKLGVNALYDENIPGDSLKIIDTTNLDTSKIIAYENKVVGVPPAPEGSRWYYLTPNTLWSENPPTSMKPGEVVGILLGLKNPKTTRFNVAVSEKVVANNRIYTGDINLSEIAALPNGEIINLPTPPTNTFWKYKYDNGDWTAEFMLDKPYKYVDVELQANDGHGLSDMVEKNLANISLNIIDASNFDMSNVKALAGASEISGLPTILENSMHWEYKIFGSQWSDHLLADLTPGLEVAIRLIPNENTAFTKPVTASVTVQPIMINVPEKITLDYVIIHSDGTFENMPSDKYGFPIDIPNASWQYSLNGDYWTPIIPTSPFPPQSSISIRLASLDPNLSLSRKLERDMIPVVPW